MLILNEERFARDVYDGKNKDVKSVLLKVGYITRYLLHSLNQSDEDIYKNTVDWLKKYHNNFDEVYYSKLIADAVTRAHNKPFYHIENIKITKSEISAISSLDNLRAEKVLFVLLCMAKHQAISNGFTNGLVKYSITELCKTARISVPAGEREYILYNIIQNGLLDYPKKNNTQCLIVNFIDDCEDEVELTLSESDCYELAYLYLSWKNNGKGYTKCKRCGRIIKQSKTKPKKYCEECAKEVEKENTRERVRRHREKCNGNLTHQND